MALPPCMIDDDCGFNGVCEVATGIAAPVSTTRLWEGRYCVDFECVACRDNADAKRVCALRTAAWTVFRIRLPQWNCSDNNICRDAACDDPYEPNDEGNRSGNPLDQDSQNAYACSDDDFTVNLPPNTSALSADVRT